jgi:hypothetical protein
MIDHINTPVSPRGDALETSTLVILRPTHVRTHTSYATTFTFHARSSREFIYYPAIYVFISFFPSRVLLELGSSRRSTYSSATTLMYVRAVGLILVCWRYTPS